MEWTRIEGRNLPSTFQQVLSNMQYIQEEVLPLVNTVNEDVIPIIDELKETIFNPGGGDEKPSDITYDDTDGMRVLGVSVDSSDPETNRRPADYTRNVNYELKKAAAVGLDGRRGITNAYVTIMTVHMADDLGYPVWQCAYGDEKLTLYFRRAQDDDTWGEWMLAAGGGGSSVIESETQPADEAQDAGDFWLQPVVEPEEDTSDDDDGGSETPQTDV